MAIFANFITGGVNNHTTTSEEGNSFATDFVTNGVVGTTSNTSGVAPMTGGLAVNAQGSPNMTVAVTAGQAYIQATPTGQGSQRIRVYMSSNENVTINANSSGSTRYDWVYLRIDAAKAAAPNLAGDDVAALVTSRSTSPASDDGTPPTFGIAIAVVTVANGATSITNGNIRDVRAQALVSATSTNDTGWVTTRNAVALPTPNTVAYNGNGSYTLTFNSTDLTTYLSNGMNIRTTRTVSAPTQCTSLNGTTQYFNRASAFVNGMSFTDDFVVSAWVKLNAYQNSIIFSRHNGTSGWYLQCTASGQISLVGTNGGGGNFKAVTSYQSIPLNKWVHITAELDMSAISGANTGIGTTQNYIMIGGVDVPVATTQGGTNPTALVQAGNLEIGSWNGGTLPFNGKLAQVAIFSAKVTQATIRSYISQGLSGTESNLVSAYSFNNSINDLNTTNANNLTAQASATATNDDSPFSTNSLGVETGIFDFGKIMSNTFSTNTTMVVQVPEGCTIPTSGGVSAMAYSTQASPYGFTVDRGRWELVSILKTLRTQVSPVSGTVYNLGQQLTVPVGQWREYADVTMGVDRASAGIVKVVSFLSTANNTRPDTQETIYFESASVTALYGNGHAEKNQNYTSQTIKYLNIATDTTSMNNIYLLGDRGQVNIVAIPQGI